MIKVTKALTLSLLAISSLANSHINLAEELKPLWNSWKVYHDKEYALPAEEAGRFAIFVENYKKVVAFNAESNGVKLALNSFADLTSEEFKAIYIGGYQPLPHQHSVSHVDYGVLSLPASVDWRKKGAVTPVENPQQCASWTFSVVGALESLYFIDSGKLLEFSGQQIVDCDSESEGCNGGFPNQAFEYTAKFGIEMEQDYPYTEGQGTCKYDASKAIHVNSGYKDITTKNADALKAALVVQPVSIAIEADQSIFQFYSSGVIGGTSCGANLDHAVLAVGYMSVSGEEAFIVKNDWGVNWGDQGYVYISTNGSANKGNGVCGILAEPVVPTA